MSERILYRIVDANFNRAREALRVLEEVARFGLNLPELSGRAKDLRHRLCRAVDRLPATRLLSARNSSGDVGADLHVPAQQRRHGLEDCLTAAGKRLSEALRALAEAAQPLDPEVTRRVEALRFAGYDLEQAITLRGLPARRWAAVRLYVLLTGVETGRILDLAGACIRGGAQCLQLRCKDLPDRDYVALAREVAVCCREQGVLSIVNDRIDIAVAAGADGVHLGRDDLDTATARALQTEPLVVGRTTHNAAELAEVVAEGPTYVALGPAFATATKPDLVPAGLDYVRSGLGRVDAAGLGHVVIGGITAANLDDVLDAGARTVALSRAVVTAPDPEALCRLLREHLDARVCPQEVKR